MLVFTPGWVMNGIRCEKMGIRGRQVEGSKIHGEADALLITRRPLEIFTVVTLSGEKGFFQQ